MIDPAHKTHVAPAIKRPVDGVPELGIVLEADPFDEEARV
jgi:hypothetical protein